MELANRHILLGVTGGVAAFKAAELARELQRRGATVQVVMTGAGARFVTPVTFQALTGRPVFTDQWDPAVPNNMAHIELSRQARRDRRRAGHRRLHRQARARAGRRPALHAVPGAQLPAAGRARDEPRDVGEPRHAAQRRPACERRRQAARPRQRRPGLRRGRHGTHARGRSTRRRDDRLPRRQAARRATRADHRGPDLRADRPGARHHQPVLRKDGLRDRARLPARRRRGDHGVGTHRARDAARRRAHRRDDRAPDVGRGGRGARSARRAPISSSRWPRWPTGGWPTPAPAS